MYHKKSFHATVVKPWTAGNGVEVGVEEVSPTAINTLLRCPLY